MFLKGIKGLRGRPHHSILTTCKYERLSEEALLDLVTHYLEHGDKSSRDKIIESHMPLALHKASIYAARYPNKADDIQAEAVIALVNTVDKAKERMYNFNMTGFISCNVDGAISSFLRKDKLIPTPVGVRATVITIATSIEHGKVDPDNTAYTNESETSILPYVTDDHTYDTLELLNRLTPLEKEIIYLKLSGYGDPEIAKKIGYSTSRVAQFRSGIGDKLTLKKGRR